MRVTADPGALRQTKWYEYLIRFVFGGLITVFAGLVAHQFGPVVGGLFLAFPAIFPASVTLVEKHEQQKGERDGHVLEQHGIRASGIEAAGAAMGSIGLVAFGLIVWWLAPSTRAWEVLVCATAGWAAVSFIVWAIRQKV